MWLALLFAFLLWGCSNSEDVPSPETPHAEYSLLDSLPGMVHIVSTDSSVVIGTNDSLAKQNERPQMTVEFDYDFAISRNEVTCAEYNALMKVPLACENDSVPATDMTFFDAVLYANELSKSEGRDTAYTYSSVNYNYEGHCTGLEGYAFHPEANALEFSLFARNGQMIQQADHKSADRVIILRNQIQFQLLIDIRKLRRTLCHKLPVCNLYDIFLLIHIVLVADFAHNLLHQILQGQETCR